RPSPRPWSWTRGRGGGACGTPAGRPPRPPRAGSPTPPSPNSPTSSTIPRPSSPTVRWCRSGGPLRPRILRRPRPIAPTSPKRPAGPPISPPPARSRRVTRRPTELSPVLTTPAEVDLRELITADSLLIALDFDGVLAPLQDDPQTSRLAPDSAAAIDVLARLPRTRVALVSGRDIATLRRLSAVPETVWLIGSHGAEAELGAKAELGTGAELDAGAELGAGAAAAPDPDPDLTVEEARMLAAIDAHIVDFEHTLSDRDGFSGVRVEAKPYSRTVHTRGLDPELAATLHDHAAA